MSEITKLYENANIKPDCTYLFLVDGNGENEAARTISIGSKADLKRWIVDCGVKGRVIKSTNTLKPFYPPFTAEKQIELIKLLSYYYNITISKNFENDYRFQCEGDDVRPYFFTSGQDFAEQLAVFVNMCYEYLSEEEKQQVKGILE